MVATAKPVGERRTRESYGRYYEDFEIGDIYEHRPGRSISEADNTWFTLLTMNKHPLHFDKEFAKHSEFGQPIVNSCLTLSIVAGMSVSDVSQKSGRGRHTTTDSSMYKWDERSYIIDTPGIRSLGIDNIEKNSLRYFFPEFELFSERCKFRDCPR